MKRRLEILEPRHLLAADIEVVHLPYEQARVGEEVTRMIQIFSDESVEVEVHSRLADELETAEWRRFDSYGKEFGSPADGGERIVSYPDAKTGKQIGDFNGDDVDDVLLELSDGTFQIVFGGTGRRGARILPPTLDRGISPPKPEIRSISDVNGDGFDDLAYTRLADQGHGLAIIYGNSNLGLGDKIEVGALPTPYSSIIDDASEIDFVGDVNQDGFSDIVIGQWKSGKFGSNVFTDYFIDPAHMIFGSGVFQPNTRISLGTLVATSSFSMSFNVIEHPTAVGDFNGDGFDDFVIESLGTQDTRIVLGGTDSEFQSVWLPDNKRVDLTGYRLLIEASDFNGDGFSDLLFSFTGRNCDCGSTGRPHVTGGMQVVHGQRFDPDPNSQPTLPRTEFLLDQRSPRAEAGKWGGGGNFENFDFSLDGDPFADIRFATRNGLIVIRGSSSLKGLDFGHVSDESTGFDGRSVYGFKGLNATFDLNGDGIHDFMMDQEVVLSQPKAFSAAGQGNIRETIEIGRNRSVVYEVTGRLKVNAVGISTTALMTNQKEQRLENNLVSPLDGVLLKATIGAPRVEGEQAEVDVVISNDGPLNAINVAIEETLTNRLADVTWAKTTRLFPPEIHMGSMAPGVGVRLVGPTLPRVFTGADIPPNEEQLERYVDAPFYGSLGHVVGTLGDVNADGIDDVFLNYREDRRGPWQSLQFHGALDFAKDGFSEPLTTNHARQALSTRELTFGDLNDDGFDDSIQIVEDEDWFESGRRDVDPVGLDVVFGGPGIDLTNPPSTLNGENGFRVTFPHSNSVEPTFVSDFDVTGDGIDDLLIGDYFAGKTSNGSPFHGAAYLVFGRKHSTSKGNGPMRDTSEVPVGAEVVYTIRGMMPDGEQLLGEVRVQVHSTQIDLESQVKRATIGTIPGDIDGNGEVDFTDFLILSTNFGETSDEAIPGDLNDDHVVDFTDFLILRENFGRSISSR